MHARRNHTPPSTSVCAQQLEGRVRAVIWQDSEEDGPCVLELHDGQRVRCEEGAQRISVGDYRRWLGGYTEHAKYGRQFAASCSLAAVNGDRAGMIRYLAELCEGIGSTLARRLVDAYGTEAVRILRERPGDVAAAGVIPGHVAVAAQSILAQHAATERVTTALHGLLAGRGFGVRALRAAILTWGDRADRVIEGCPWRLLLDAIPGAGWRRVDALYRDLGYDPAALLRQALAGYWAVRSAQEGSTWHPEGLFRRGLLGEVDVLAARGDDALALAVRARWVERSRPDLAPDLIADPAAANNERAVAYYLARLMKAGPAEWPCLTTPAVSEHQAEQINSAARGRVLLLTGTPGTGKTFAAAAVLRLVARSAGTASIAVAAPTGKAAVRITEALRSNGVDIEATTIHRLLKIRKAGYDGNGWSFQHCDSDPLPFAWLAIDEVSMLDCSLAKAFFCAVRPGTHVLLIGDPHQLPPVGHGAPLRDLIAAHVPCAELTEIKRNSGLITTGCRAIKDGRPPACAAKLNADAGDNLRMVSCLTDTDQLRAVRAILEGLRGRPGIDVIWDCAILTPCNDKGMVSRKPLNDYLRELLNPARENDAKAGQDVWRLRDKVICLKNGMQDAQGFDAGRDVCRVENWHPVEIGNGDEKSVFVANGELGRVVATHGVKRDVILRFDAPTRYVLVQAPKRVQHDDGTDSAREEFFALGYAITGHKSQGSEWPYVLVILDPGGDRVASREWVYTAISRAKRACWLIGTEETLRRQIRRAELPGRKTLLRELILEELKNGRP